MSEKTTIKEIAERVGTSVASVHRALHGRSGVSEALRERVISEAKRSHYTMDETAAILRRNTMQIAVLLPKPENNERFYFRGLWKGIEKGEEELRGKANIIKVQTEYGIDHFSEALERFFDEADLYGEHLEGLITVCDDEESRVWIQRFIRQGIKVVLVDRDMPIDDLVCTIDVSPEDLGRMAAELLSLFCKSEEGKQIILVNGNRIRKSYQQYAEALYRRLDEEHHIKESGICEITTVSEEQVRKELRKKLEEGNIGVIAAASARGTYWVCDEIEKAFRDKAERPLVIGTDVFEELGPFFENGTLKASVYQFHIESGEQSIRQMFDSLISIEAKENMHIRQSIAIAMRDNYKYFLAD